MSEDSGSAGGRDTARGRHHTQGPGYGDTGHTRGDFIREGLDLSGLAHPGTLLKMELGKWWRDTVKYSNHVLMNPPAMYSSTPCITNHGYCGGS